MKTAIININASDLTIQFDDVRLNEPFRIGNIVITGNLDIDIEIETEDPGTVLGKVESFDPGVTGAANGTATGIDLGKPDQLQRQAVVNKGYVRFVIPGHEYLTKFRVNGVKNGVHFSDGDTVIVRFHPKDLEQGADIFWRGNFIIKAPLVQEVPISRVDPSANQIPTGLFNSTKTGRKWTAEDVKMLRQRLAEIAPPEPSFFPRWLADALEKIKTIGTACEPFCEHTRNEQFNRLLEFWRGALAAKASKLKNPEDTQPLLELAKRIEGHLKDMGMQYSSSTYSQVEPFLNLTARQLIADIREAFKAAPTPVAP